MEPRPRIAVVIPTHNDGAYVREALASVDGQEPCEVVVVDSASDDPDTLRVLDELRASGVRVVRHDVPGVSRARMRGVAESTAPLVFCLDADDVLVPGILTALADALEADPGLSATWGDMHTFGTTDVVSRCWRYVDQNLLRFMNRLPAGALHRREALLASGGWNLDGQHQDWDLWLTYAQMGLRGRNIERVHLWYRTHPSSREYDRGRDRHAQIVTALRERHRELGARGYVHTDTECPPALFLVLRTLGRLPFRNERHRSRAFDLAIRSVVPRARLVVDGRSEPAPVVTWLRRLAGDRRRLQTRHLPES